MLINITAAHKTPGTLLIPYMICLYLCVLFVSRHSAGQRASFQNLLFVSSDDSVSSSFLVYNFHYYGRKHEEDSHEPNTVFVTVLEAS